MGKTYKESRAGSKQSEKAIAYKKGKSPKHAKLKPYNRCQNESN